MKQYMVHVYRTIRFKIGVSAENDEGALKAADEALPDAIKRSEWDAYGCVNTEADILRASGGASKLFHAEDAEETTAYLIDDLDDTEYENSRYFYGDGKPDDLTRKPIMVNPAERDTLLAALRFWQRQGNTSNLPEWDIAVNGRDSFLEDADIDGLCERINS